jgi:hypothetical protein
MKIYKNDGFWTTKNGWCFELSFDPNVDIKYLSDRITKNYPPLSDDAKKFYARVLREILKEQF